MVVWLSVGTNLAIQHKDGRPEAAETDGGTESGRLQPVGWTVPFNETGSSGET